MDAFTFTELVSRLDRLIELLEVNNMALEALTAEVAAIKTVAGSAVTLIEGLAARIEELKTDPIALQNLADELKQSSTALGEAVAANTPVP